MAQVDIYGPASWPALYGAGIALSETHSAEWLPILREYGPAAESARIEADLPHPLCSEILGQAAAYPPQWVLAAGDSCSLRSIEQPLLRKATTWFDD